MYFLWLFFIHRNKPPGYVGTSTNLQTVLNPPYKNPYLNQATQINTCKFLNPPKNLEMKISKNSFDHPCHLKSGVHTPGMHISCCDCTLIISEPMGVIRQIDSISCNACDKNLTSCYLRQHQCMSDKKIIRGRQRSLLEQPLGLINRDSWVETSHFRWIFLASHFRLILYQFFKLLVCSLCLLSTILCPFSVVFQSFLSHFYPFDIWAWVCDNLGCGISTDCDLKIQEDAWRRGTPGGWSNSFRWGNLPYNVPYGHPTYHVNAIKLIGEIVRTGGLPHLSR